MLKSRSYLIGLSLLLLSAGCSDDSTSAGTACKANQCTIDEQCVDDGMANNANPCVVCDVSTNNSQWSLAANATCDDGDACTTDDRCLEGKCIATPITCAADGPCSQGACEKGKCITVPATGGCNDNDACTENDQCQDGKCSGQPLSCNDNNPCTDDVCDAATGCTNAANTTTCDDGDSCTVDDVCTDKKCAGTALNCDDQNECTTDSCSQEAGCQHELLISAACRPEIAVSFPARGATIKSNSNEVTVKGTVKSGAGAITTLVVNGSDVAVSKDGSWQFDMDATMGGNLLVIEATDEQGSIRTRVQSYLWSSKYLKPEKKQKTSGFVTPGLGVFLAQKVMDDGDHTQPPDDLATVFEMMLDSINVGSYISNPVYSGTTHKVNVKGMANSAPKVQLKSQSGGLKLTVSISNIAGKVDANGKCKMVLGACIPLGPDADGTISISKVTVTADVALSTKNNQLKATIKNLSVSMSTPDVSLDGVVGFLANPIIDFFEDDIKDELVSAFESTLSVHLQPVLEKALSSIAINETFDLPSVDGKPVPITVSSDFHQVAFNSTGGAIRMRTRIVSNDSTADTQLGFPLRMGCGDSTQTLVLPKAHPLEVSVSDNTLNSLLYAAWRGGILNLNVPLDQNELSKHGVTDVVIEVSGTTPPVVSDCNSNNQLMLQLGDVKADATLKFANVPMSFTVFITLSATAELSVEDGEFTFAIKELTSVNKDVTVHEDPLITLEAEIVKVIDDQLVPQLIKHLGGGNIAGIPLPDLDLGGLIDAVPAGTKISIEPSETTRQGGNTIVGGELK